MTDEIMKDEKPRRGLRFSDFADYGPVGMTSKAQERNYSQGDLCRVCGTRVHNGSQTCLRHRNTWRVWKARARAWYDMIITLAEDEAPLDTIIWERRQ